MDGWKTILSFWGPASFQGATGSVCSIFVGIQWYFWAIGSIKPTSFAPGTTFSMFVDSSSSSSSSSSRWIDVIFSRFLVELFQMCCKKASSYDHPATNRFNECHTHSKSTHNPYQACAARLGRPLPWLEIISRKLFATKKTAAERIVSWDEGKQRMFFFTDLNMGVCGLKTLTHVIKHDKPWKTPVSFSGFFFWKGLLNLKLRKKQFLCCDEKIQLAVHRAIQQLELRCRWSSFVFVTKELEL